MKKTTKAKAEVKRAAKGPLGPRAVRDLELLDPAARKLKGGMTRPRKPRGPR
jgi:hypothetical protein